LFHVSKWVLGVTQCIIHGDALKCNCKHGLVYSIQVRGLHGIEIRQWCRYICYLLLIGMWQTVFYVSKLVLEVTQCNIYVDA